uniref:hypothetical protein n=1 Tax=Candidatus Electronema sp. TaxID=2698783 RepID=UPI004056608B
MIAVNELLAKRKPAVIGGALALVLISWLFWYFSDQQVIKRQLTALAWDLDKESRQESTMETALKMRDVKAVLAESCCTLIVPERGRRTDFAERDMAVMYLMHYRDRYENLAVSFEDMEIDFPAKGEAAVRSQARLLRQVKPDQPAAETTAPVLISLKKQDGDWMLTQAEVAEALLDDLKY